MERHDYPSAEKFFFQAVDINEKVFGEGSNRVAESLLLPGQMYVVRKDYAKAEPYLQRAVHIDEALYGQDSIDLVRPLSGLCYLYDQWGKPDQSDACDRHLLTILEKGYGKDSPVIVQVLVSDAKQLRAMGHTADAEQLDKRVASIRATTMKPN
ncbi:MAG TPA: tetratricopeptide repeat protein, partial [Candidatus Acidoferrales bacterium]|nr:tetratricopeptide repeat protein [Candidatus Acidoferrales bacterium]